MPMAQIDMDNQPGGWFQRLVNGLRGSLLWLGAVALSALAATAAFFFALAALSGIFIIAAAVMIAWLIFRLAGARKRRAADSGILNATEGPQGWTVDIRETYRGN